MIFFYSFFLLSLFFFFFFFNDTATTEIYTLSLHDALPFYYLPDLDFGRKGTIFVPFFGVPAATATGLSAIARSTGAAVVPCVTRMLPGGGYVAQFYPAWRDYPTGARRPHRRRSGNRATPGRTVPHR